MANLFILDLSYTAGTEAIVAEDPFTRGGVAADTVTEFVPTTTAPALEALRVV